MLKQFRSWRMGWEWGGDGWEMVGTSIYSSFLKWRALLQLTSLWPRISNLGLCCAVSQGWMCANEKWPFYHLWRRHWMLFFTFYTIKKTGTPNPILIFGSNVTTQNLQIQYNYSIHVYPGSTRMWKVLILKLELLLQHVPHITFIHYTCKRTVPVPHVHLDMYTTVVHFFMFSFFLIHSFGTIDTTTIAFQFITV